MVWRAHLHLPISHTHKKAHTNTNRTKQTNNRQQQHQLKKRLWTTTKQKQIQNDWKRLNTQNCTRMFNQFNKCMRQYYAQNFDVSSSPMLDFSAFLIFWTKIPDFPNVMINLNDFVAVSKSIVSIESFEAHKFRAKRTSESIFQLLVTEVVASEYIGNIIGTGNFQLTYNLTYRLINSMQNWSDWENYCIIVIQADFGRKIMNKCKLPVTQYVVHALPSSRANKAIVKQFDVSKCDMIWFHEI